MKCKNITLDIEEDIDIKEICKQYDDNTDSIQGYLSSPIKHHNKNKQSVVTWLEKPRRSTPIFFLKPDLIMAITAKYHAAYNVRNYKYTSGDYISSIQNIGIRRDPYGDNSEYRRVGKDESIAEIFMYVTTYNGDLTYQKIIEDQKTIATVIWQNIWGDEDKIKNIGTTIITKWEEKGGKMIDWLLNAKGGPEKSKEIAATNIRNNITSYFKNGVTWKTKINLDKYLVDYDIMELVTKKMGYTSWDDMSEDQKQICYKNFPNKVLPDWNKLTKETYNK